jgi:hypothetical protein
VTVVAFASCKGAPGVTTLVTLVGAAWTGRRPVVVEHDPSGGDLAARFGLSSRCGWSSAHTAIRREGAIGDLGPHLQQLPGGLDVLVGTRPPTPSGDGDGERTAAGLCEAAEGMEHGADLLVDLGRLASDEPVRCWLHRAERVVIVSAADPASVLQVREHAPSLVDRSVGAVGLVLVGAPDHRPEEIADFTGLPVLGTLPFDRETALAVCGAHAPARRVLRSRLVRSATRLASELRAVGPGAATAADGARTVAEPVDDGAPHAWAVHR